MAQQSHKWLLFPLFFYYISFDVPLQLTSAERYYLFNTRANASSKYGIGNINGVKGLIVLPDNWTLPSGYTFNSGFSSSDDYWWTLNSYTLAQWAVMEAAGAVFLPAAGRRWGTNLDNLGVQGNYWTSTPSIENRAYSMVFDNVYLSGSNPGCSNGLSVRLVMEND